MSRPRERTINIPSCRPFQAQGTEPEDTMRNKEDTCWLRFCKRGPDLAIHRTDRLSEVLKHVNVNGTPSLFLFIGKTARRAALRTLTAPSPAIHGQEGIHLRRDPKTLQSDRPLLFAEGPPSTHLASTHDDGTGDAIQLSTGNLTGAVQAMYSRLLSPFADVVCIFLSDFSGIAELVDFISTWIQNACSPCPVLPRLVIVVADLKTDRVYWKGNFVRMLHRRTETPLQAAFSGLTVHSLAPVGALSDKLRYERLRASLLIESDLVRSWRIQKQMLFHGGHITALFDDAYSRLLRNADFDYIIASRTSNPVPSGAARQVALFLRDFRGTEVLNTFALPVIASAFMVDAFPPEMHRMCPLLALLPRGYWRNAELFWLEFNPIDVYRTLYQQIWRHTAKALHLGAESIQTFEDLIENRYQSGQLSTGKEAHGQLMLSFSDQWRLYRNNATCLMCLLRRPEYGLPCGHVFCDVDIRRFGKEVCKDTFVAGSCFLCSKETNGAKFRLKPRTKGISILAIDGGGVRGIIPLQLLQLLELKLKPYLSEFPIQNHFDMTVGTSSGKHNPSPDHGDANDLGGIISLAAVHQGMSISECIKTFQELSAKAFTRRFGHSASVLSKAWNLVVSLFADSLYPSQNIDETLKKQFGDKDTLLDYSAASARGAKVAVTATGVPKGEHVITNYNGVGSKDFRQGYRHALPDDPSVNIKTWEA